MAVIPPATERKGAQGKSSKALISSAVEDTVGRRPELSTSGGTSDARFVASYAPVAEFGLVGKTMHKVDEFTTVEDMTTLKTIYSTILDRFFMEATA